MLTCFSVDPFVRRTRVSTLAAVPLSNQSLLNGFLILSKSRLNIYSKRQLAAKIVQVITSMDAVKWRKLVWNTRCFLFLLQCFVNHPATPFIRRGVWIDTVHAASLTFCWIIKRPTREPDVKNERAPFTLPFLKRHIKNPLQKNRIFPIFDRPIDSWSPASVVVPIVIAKFLRFRAI